jgi:hypothetical protein
VPKAATSKSAVFEPPGLAPAVTLRPDAVARLELLRIIFRPDKDADTLIAMATKLERYVSGTGPSDL